MQQASVTPVTILTGYLGAGKTTLLNRILHADHGLKVAVLVNDFGAVNIDSKLIVGVEEEAISLANGCICCTIRGDLVAAMTNLLDRDDPPQYILIEASGVSDPAQVVLTFNRSGLRNRVQIDSIVAMVDAEQILTISGKPEALVKDQIRVADIVILNKVDLISEENANRLQAWVRDLVPTARVIPAIYADVPMELLLGVGSYNPQRAFMKPHGVHVHDVDELHDHDHSDHSLVYSTWTWRSMGHPVSIQGIRRVLDDLPEGVYRGKGFLYTLEMPQHKVVLQVVGKRAALTQGDDWGSELPYSEVVLIGEVGTLDKARLKEMFDATRAEEAPAAESGRVFDGVLRWLRLK